MAQSLDKHTSIVLGVEMLMHLVARNYCIDGCGTSVKELQLFSNVLD